MTKAVEIKDWCEKNISPQSWTRVCLKSVNAIRAAGFSLYEIENPNEEQEIDAELLYVFNKSLKELYDKTYE